MVTQPHWIAERKLVAIDRATGERTPIVLRIAAPVPWGDDGDAACNLEIAGMLENIKPVIGIDGVQALAEACRFLDLYLDGRRDRFDLRFPTGEPYPGVWGIHADGQP